MYTCHGLMRTSYPRICCTIRKDPVETISWDNVVATKWSRGSSTAGWTWLRGTAGRPGVYWTTRIAGSWCTAWGPGVNRTTSVTGSCCTARGPGVDWTLAVASSTSTAGGRGVDRTHSFLYLLIFLVGKYRVSVFKSLVYNFIKNYNKFTVWRNCKRNIERPIIHSVACPIITRVFSKTLKISQLLKINNVRLAVSAYLS